MRLLLDTHIAVWWLAGDRRLGPAARATIEAADTAYLSSVSVWEIVIKQARGRLDTRAWERLVCRTRQAEAEAARVEVERLLPLGHDAPARQRLGVRVDFGFEAHFDAGGHLELAGRGTHAHRPERK